MRLIRLVVDGLMCGCSRDKLYLSRYFVLANVLLVFRKDLLWWFEKYRQVAQEASFNEST